MAQFNIGDKVRDKFNGKIGRIVQNRRSGNHNDRYLVEYSPNDKAFISGDDLELVNDEDIVDMFGKGHFAGIDVLKRIMIYTRIKGDVTNIFYSMHNSSTSFFPHQFIPVVKFIESTTGRILIADEVGLGKTIEAIYIWQELVARENSRRLLIVCPSVLREKWAQDLDRYFSIKAEICDAQKLLQYARSAANKPIQEHFVLIASLEGIRYKEKNLNNDGNVTNSSRAALDNFLDEESAKEIGSLFDLVVVDEAHYLRNSETASHKTVSKLRDVAKNLVLLSATPIQTSEENLYNLLNILDPEVFYDKHAFSVLLAKSQNYVKIANALTTGGSIDVIKRLLSDLKQNPMFVHDELLCDFENNLIQIMNDAALRIDYQKQFRKKVFYSSYFTRSRRRETFLDRPDRVSETWNFPMNNREKNIYDQITAALKKESKKVDTFCQFRIIARQRQMTSCLPAALEDWQNKSFGEDLREMLYEDLDYDDENDLGKFDIADIISNGQISFNIDNLRKNDSKYSTLITKIKEKFEKNPEAKIIIFSFYRGTVKYLAERFKKDGIESICLMGGQGVQKQDVVDKFRDDPTIRILVSTEVGSEGIDLQFCDTEINYDLPWNPMRLEQRIGRIDRIGQKAKQLHIVNMVCDGSIEDRVLMRLYSRIEIFKNSIGEIEEILGKQIQDIALSLLNSTLSDADMEKKAEEQIELLIRKKKQMEDLENEAPSLMAFKDYILQNVEDANHVQRFIHPADLIFYVRDFLESQYPGSSVADYGIVGCKEVSLSKDAAFEFANYCREEGVDCVLAHSSSKLICVFDSGVKEKVKNKSVDVITPIHPLIKWITQKNTNQLLENNGCCSVSIKASDKIDPGMYAFYIMEHIAEGYISRKEIHYYMCRIDNCEMVDRTNSEIVMARLLSSEKACWNAGWRDDISSMQDAVDALNKAMDFGYEELDKFEKDYKRENEEICKNQLEYLDETTNRKIRSLEQTIENMKIDGNKQQGIKLLERKLEVAKKNQEFQKERIEQKLKARCNYNDVALGLLKIE